MELEVKEIIAKFQAEIFILGSYLTKEGKTEVLERINDFTILKKDKKDETKKEKEDKKLPPKGSYERMMNIFGGGK